MTDSPPGFRGRYTTAAGPRAAAGSASGILRITPSAVASPADADDLAVLVRWAAAASAPLVPRGAGTGMPGGNVGRGITVDLVTGFQEIGPVDPVHRLARVEPGITHAALASATLACGLHFPVDPSSGARCTLGGMIANDSAGAHSVKYGTTRRWVRSLDLVLADGTRATTRRGERPASERLRNIKELVDSKILPQRDAILAGWPRLRKNSSGYALEAYLRSGDLIDLIVGSEGTLALVVGAEMALTPPPASTALALLQFASLDAAAETVQQLLPLEPATCEMLDRTFLRMVQDAGAKTPFPLDPRIEALLLVEVDGPSPAAVAESLSRVERAADGRATAVVLAVEPELQTELWTIRHAASPIIAARADGRLSMQFIEDGVVPVERLADYIRLLRDVLARHDTPAVIFGHAGDGNLHVNPLVDVHAPGYRQRLASILQEVAAGVGGMGGTLAGEHGDGRLRAPLLETIWGRQMVERFRAIKDAFDPHGLLNPGVILPLPGQDPFDGLPDLPTSAPPPAP